MVLTDLDLAFMAKAAYPGLKPYVLNTFDIIVEFYDKKTDTEALLA